MTDTRGVSVLLGCRLRWAAALHELEAAAPLRLQFFPKARELLSGAQSTISTREGRTGQFPLIQRDTVPGVVP